MAKEITIIISPDGGQVKMDAAGFEGSMCEETITKLIEGIGTMSSSDRKPEYYAQGGTGIHVGN
jgi:hypothetical protein